LANLPGLIVIRRWREAISSVSKKMNARPSGFRPNHSYR
jgi:hypothetical protein